MRWNQTRISFEMLRNYTHDNILAFGDLIHRIHPLAGQGFNMTIRDLINLEKTLKNAGYRKSKVDSCLFYKDGKLLLVYVDDILICTPTKEGHLSVLEDLRKMYELNEIKPEFKGNKRCVFQFLGINIDYCRERREMFLSQHNLIQKDLILV